MAWRWKDEEDSHADRCKRGGDYIRQKEVQMKNSSRRPICTVVAAILPVVTFGVLAYIHERWHVGGLEGFGFAMMLLLILAASVVVSLILAIVSLLRNERLWGLALAEVLVYSLLSLLAFHVFTST